MLVFPVKLEIRGSIWGYISRKKRISEGFQITFEGSKYSQELHEFEKINIFKNLDPRKGGSIRLSFSKIPKRIKFCQSKQENSYALSKSWLVLKHTEYGDRLAS